MPTEKHNEVSGDPADNIGQLLSYSMNAMNDLRWEDAHKALDLANEQFAGLDEEVQEYFKNTIPLFREVIELQHSILTAGTVEDIRNDLAKMRAAVQYVLGKIPEEAQMEQVRDNLNNAILSMELSDDVIPLRLTLEYLANKARGFRDKLDTIENKYDLEEIRQMTERLRFFADVHESSLALRIAKRSGDQNEIHEKLMAYNAVLERMKTQDDNSIAHVLQLYISTNNRLPEVIWAVQQLDLDRASALIELINEEVAQAEELLNAGIESLEGQVFDNFAQVIKGLKVIIESYTVYTKALLQAVVGDVTDDQLQALVDSEQRLNPAVDMVADAFLKMNEMSPDQVEANARAQKSLGIMMSNLRRLANTQKQ